MGTRDNQLQNQIPHKISKKNGFWWSMKTIVEYEW